MVFYWSGKKLSKEHRKHISETRKKLYKEGKAVPWNKGIPRTKEEKKVISKAVKNFWETHPEQKKKQGMGSYNKEERKLMGKKSSETKKRLFKEGKLKPWNKGLTKETNKILKKVSEKLSGRKRETPWMFGEKNWSKRLWQDPKFREKTIKAIMLAQHKKPNKKEQFLIKLFQENKLPYRFVGDGKLIIGGKCPDFVNVNGQKKIIEMFGDYWHNKPNMKYHQTEKGTIEHYKNFGFRTLVIWEHELKEEFRITEKIRKFEYGLKKEMGL